MGASLCFGTDRDLPSKMLATTYLRLSYSEILQVWVILLQGGAVADRQQNSIGPKPISQSKISPRQHCRTGPWTQVSYISCSTLASLLHTPLLLHHMLQINYLQIWLTPENVRCWPHLETSLVASALEPHSHVSKWKFWQRSRGVEISNICADTQTLSFSDRYLRFDWRQRQRVKINSWMGLKIEV